MNKKREENLARFGLSGEEIELIVIPLPKASAVLSDNERREKLLKLAALQAEYLVQEQDAMYNDEGEDDFMPIKKRRSGRT